MCASPQQLSTTRGTPDCVGKAKAPLNPARTPAGQVLVCQGHTPAPQHSATTTTSCLVTTLGDSPHGTQQTGVLTPVLRLLCCVFDEHIVSLR
ncbi:hypothetical protein E2C01_046018 [Portunus trituberculatus]|uniref:Uncharacterized protein n=1 Tax=Portunus trituberculatus TaxID=210409 RepID=A0A5B7G347_PORTR|nr:hypothetical protein [Portunus trituberculatus]